MAAKTKKSRGRAKSRWSGRVTRESDALDLDRGVFTWKDPKRIAASLKRSAERSRRRKAEPYRSAMSMLTFYVNRAGGHLPAERRRVLERAKEQLRHLFKGSGSPAGRKRASKSRARRRRPPGAGRTGRGRR